MNKPQTTIQLIREYVMEQDAYKAERIRTLNVDLLIELPVYEAQRKEYSRILAAKGLDKMLAEFNNGVDIKYAARAVLYDFDSYQRFDREVEQMFDTPRVACGIVNGLRLEAILACTGRDGRTDLKRVEHYTMMVGQDAVYEAIRQLDHLDTPNLPYGADELVGIKLGRALGRIAAKAKNPEQVRDSDFALCTSRMGEALQSYTPPAVDLATAVPDDFNVDSMISALNPPVPGNYNLRGFLGGR